MAIQMRRGALADYDKDKMIAGEFAVTTDNDTEDQRVFVAFAPGVSKRLLTEEDDVVEVDDALDSTSTNPVQNNVIKTALDTKAPKASPQFTGSPTAPTPSASDTSTRIATTAFVQNAINSKTKIWIGTCSTNSNVAEKVITVSDSNFTLETNTLLLVTFSSSNTARNITFNVNSLGAKNVYAYGSRSASPKFGSYKPTLFRYTNNRWEMVDAGVSLKAASNSSFAGMVSNISGRQYAVQLDANGDLSVNVPWRETIVPVVTNGNLTFTLT